MAELPVGTNLLAPYGGITRIRFKGSSDNPSDLSAHGSPAVFFRIGPEDAKSTPRRSVGVGGGASCQAPDGGWKLPLLQGEDVVARWMVKAGWGVLPGAVG